MAGRNERVINERVLEEMERVLQRPLTPEELRLLLLARVIEEEVLDRQAACLHAA